MLARGNGPSGAQIVSALRRLSLQTQSVSYTSRALSTHATRSRTSSSRHDAQSASWSRSYATESKTKATKRTTTKTAAPKSKTATAKGKVAAPKKKAKKTAPKKKKTVPKRAKKVISPEDKIRAEVRRLKKTALLQEQPPQSSTPWAQFFAERAKGKTGKATLLAQEVANEWRSLSQAEKDDYSRRTSDESAQRKEQYKAWVRQHSVEEIRLANSARTRLNNLERKLSGEKRAKHARRTYTKIKDDRQPTPKQSAYVFFLRAKMESGELDHLTPTEKMREVGKLWKGMSSSERQPFKTQAESQA